VVLEVMLVVSPTTKYHGTWGLVDREAGTPSLSPGKNHRYRPGQWYRELACSSDSSTSSATLLRSRGQDGPLQNYLADERAHWRRSLDVDSVTAAEGRKQH